MNLSSYLEREGLKERRKSYTVGGNTEVRLWTTSHIRTRDELERGSKET